MNWMMAPKYRDLESPSYSHTGTPLKKLSSKLLRLDSDDGDYSGDDELEFCNYSESINDLESEESSDSVISASEDEEEEMIINSMFKTMSTKPMLIDSVPDASKQLMRIGSASSDTDTDGGDYCWLFPEYMSKRPATRQGDSRGVEWLAACALVSILLFCVFCILDGFCVAKIEDGCGYSSGFDAGSYDKIRNNIGARSGTTIAGDAKSNISVHNHTDEGYYQYVKDGVAYEMHNIQDFPNHSISENTEKCCTWKRCCCGFWSVIASYLGMSCLCGLRWVACLHCRDWSHEQICCCTVNDFKTTNPAEFCGCWMQCAFWNMVYPFLWCSGPC